MAEEILIRQGAPTLAGIKTGSLFPCPCEDHEALMTDIRRLNRRLSPKGLCLLPLRFLPGRALLYLYRPAGLRRDLRDAQASELLRQAGYGDEKGTRYANFLEELVELEVECSEEYYALLRKRGKLSGKMTKQLLHMITSAYFTAVCETIAHDMPKEEAMRYIEELAKFFNSGWKGLLRLE